MFSTRANLGMHLEAVAKPGQVDGARLRVRAAASPAPGAHSERYSELILCVIACQVVVDKPTHPPSLRPDRIYQNVHPMNGSRRNVRLCNQPPRIFSPGGSFSSYECVCSTLKHTYINCRYT